MFLHLFSCAIILLCSVFLKLGLSKPISTQDTKSSLPQSHHPQMMDQSDPYPKLIAHRGDNILFPENTIESYESAILSDIDYVETDLVMTADGHLVCFHDIHLKQWTDVAKRPEYANKMIIYGTLYMEGEEHEIKEDWLISDFTLEQVKGLRLKQEDKGVRSFVGHRKVGIPTFSEFIESVHLNTYRKMQNNGTGQQFPTGMMVELKYTPYYNSLYREDNFLERKFFEDLATHGYMNDSCQYQGEKIPCSEMVLQSWELDAVKYFRTQTDKDVLVVLDTNNLRLLTWQGMAELQGHTNYIALHKELISAGTEADLQKENRVYNHTEMELLGGFVPGSEMISYIHSMGMKVALYTIYHSAEPSNSAVKIGSGTKEEELFYYFDHKPDAIFVEGITESIRIREKYFQEKSEMSRVRHLADVPITKGFADTAKKEHFVKKANIPSTSFQETERDQLLSM